jgi:hypothetical protein
MGALDTLKLVKLRKELQMAEATGDAAAAAEIRKKMEELKAKRKTSSLKDKPGTAGDKSGKTLLTKEA